MFILYYIRKFFSQPTVIGRLSDAMLCNLLYILTCIGLALPAFGRAQQISVSPTILNFEGAVGQTISKTIQVTNSSPEITYRFTIDMLDWNRDITGSKIFSASGTLSSSMHDDLELPETEFKLGPLQTKLVNINYKIPPKTSDQIFARNAMVVIHSHKLTQAEFERETASIDIDLAYSFGIQLFYTSREATIGDIELNEIKKLSSENSVFLVTYQNTGDVHKSGNIRMEITDMSSGKELPLPSQPFAISPRAVQEQQFILPYPLAKGRYLFIAVLDAGNIYQLKVAKKEIYVQ